MFFAPKMPNYASDNIANQLRTISEKIDVISSNYTTRQDMASLQAAIESRFLERAVATEKFDNIDKRLEAIERQLGDDKKERTEQSFVTRNNVVYWMIGVAGILYSVFNIIIWLATHYRP